MSTVLIEMWRQDGSNTKYVLRSENVQHQIQRTPTVITIPGNPDTGEPRIVGYDLGVVNETLTISGIIATQSENVVAGDPAYEAGVAKTYPGKVALRNAVLKWWADATWGVTPTGLIMLKTPLGESYEGIIQGCQFTEEPGHDYFSFALVFRICKYG